MMTNLATIGTPSLWLGFGVLVLAMLAIELPIGASLAVIAALLAAAVGASLIHNDRNTTNQSFEAKP